jgi:hypothetical protein
MIHPAGSSCLKIISLQEWKFKKNIAVLSHYQDRHLITSFYFRNIRKSRCVSP